MFISGGAGRTFVSPAILIYKKHVKGKRKENERGLRLAFKAKFVYSRCNAFTMRGKYSGMGRLPENGSGCFLKDGACIGRIQKERKVYFDERYYCQYRNSFDCIPGTGLFVPSGMECLVGRILGDHSDIHDSRTDMRNCSGSEEGRKREKTEKFKKEQQGSG